MILNNSSLLRQPPAGHHVQEEVPEVWVQIQKGGVLALGSADI